MSAVDDATFSNYSTTTTQTNIDQLSDLVNALAEAGFGFESVYIDPYYSAQLLSEAGIPDGTDDGEVVETENPITIGVAINVGPDVLTDVIREYEERYITLLVVLEEVGISEDQVPANNFNIYPACYGSGQVTSYQANTQLVIETDPSNINAVTAAVNDVDDTFVENVIISVSDEAIDGARADLTDQAIANARARASEMVEALGLEVASIKLIEAATGSSFNQYGGEVLYRGVKIVQPYYYQSITGDIAVSITVEFELAENEEE